MISLFKIVGGDTGLDLKPMVIGKNRGTYPQAILNYEFNPTIISELKGEMFMPGDYYGQDLDDAYYVRFNWTKPFN